MVCNIDKKWEGAVTLKVNVDMNIEILLGTKFVDGNLMNIN